jgi:hypothetical protein
MEKTQKKQRNYSVEFKLCAILDKLDNGLNYFETVRKHWNWWANSILIAGCFEN